MAKPTKEESLNVYGRCVEVDDKMQSTETREVYKKDSGMCGRQCTIRTRRRKAKAKPNKKRGSGSEREEKAAGEPWTMELRKEVEARYAGLHHYQ